MKRKIAPEKMTPANHDARPNRNWGFYNVPWTWEQLGINGVASAQRGGAFCVDMRVPKGSYGRIGDASRADLSARAVFKLTRPLKASPGQRLIVRHTFDGSFKLNAVVKSPHHSIIRVVIDVTTGWRLRAPTGAVTGAAPLELNPGGLHVAEVDHDLKLPKVAGEMFESIVREVGPRSWTYEAEVASLTLPVDRLEIEILFGVDLRLEVRGEHDYLQGELKGSRACSFEGTLRDAEVEVLKG